MTRTTALAAATAALFAAPVAAASGTQKTIAIVTEGNLRAVVVAHKRSGGNAPTAAITVTGYRTDGHVWHRTRSHRLTATFFWKTVTAPQGVCRLELNSVKLSLSLLVSPSIGCSKTSALPV